AELMPDGVVQQFAAEARHLRLAGDAGTAAFAPVKDQIAVGCRPADADAPRVGGKRAIFDRIGGKLVNHQRGPVQRMLAAHHRGPSHLEARPAARQKALMRFDNGAHHLFQVQGLWRRAVGTEAAADQGVVREGKRHIRSQSSLMDSGNMCVSRPIPGTGPHLMRLRRRRGFMDPLKPEELRQRARELLAASMMATDPERRASLVQLAAYYEELAVKLDTLTSPLGRLTSGRRPDTRH